MVPLLKGDSFPRRFALRSETAPLLPKEGPVRLSGPGEVPVTRCQ